MNKTLELGPGPGSYEFNTQTIKEGPSYTIGTK